MDNKNNSSAVSAVIPAFNERGRLKKVLQVVCQYPGLKEILVIDDGSTDNTRLDLEELEPKDERVRYIRLDKNQGKGKAMRAGVEHASGEYVLFLDADLYNLNSEHLDVLIRPVVEGKADMTVGIFRGGKWLTDFSQRVVPWLSGQRCMVRRVFFDIPIDLVSGYGIETAFTVLAHDLHWRLKYVPLQGAYHKPTETRRGAVTGLLWKLRMYEQIIRTYLALRRRDPHARRRAFIIGILALILVVFALTQFYNNSRADAHIGLQDLPVLDLTNAQRILVIAPHPDDETLGTGGTIQAALDKGADVRVVVVTNGDGQPAAAVALQKDITIKPEDYIKDGEIRQQESLDALKILGVPASQVSYLGFPDGQVGELWLDDWQTNCPLEGKHTQVTAVPYPDTYQPNADYCGSVLLGIIKKILVDYRPDMILLPQINDNHPDHRAATQFTLMAAAELSANDINYQPTIWGYIIHYGKYPHLRGWQLNHSLLPPIPLLTPESNWYRLNLTQQQEAAKASAIRAYKSQLELMKSYLESFARQNEIFDKVDLLEFSNTAIDTLQINQAPNLDTANLSVPDKASARQLALAGTDLTDLQASILQDRLVVTAHTRGDFLPDVEYLTRFKFSDGRTQTCILGKDGLRLTSSAFACSIDISELKTPDVVGFDAEVGKNITLDQSGWHFVILR